MKQLTAVLLICLILSACGTNSQVHSKILTWATQIANLQNDLLTLASDTQAYMGERYPTSSDCPKLTGFAERSTALYNEIVQLDRPEESRPVHNEFVDSYSKNADSYRYYSLYVCQGDVTYYDKYALALSVANKLNESAYHDFIQMLGQFSISCNDVGLCEDSVMPTSLPAQKPLVVVPPSPTSNPCLLWDQVTASMKGHKICARGIIYNFIQTRKVGTRYEFTAKSNSFFLFSARWEVIDTRTGKTLGPGTCVEVTDIVQVQSGVPFMDIDRSINGKVFTDFVFYDNSSACQ